jgi:hypothetical protein
MRLCFACTSDHAEPRPLATHSVRASLEQGQCPVCVGQALEGRPHGGLEWARCPCCDAKWRVEDEGFAVRSGGLIEEWV